MAVRRLPLLIAAVLLSALALLRSEVSAQGLIDPQRNLRIEAIEVRIVNPAADRALNSRVEDFVRRMLAAFPTDRYSEERVAVSLARAKRSPEIADVSYSPEYGPTGGVLLKVAITLGDAGIRAGPRGALTDAGVKDFPVLYEYDGAMIRAKAEFLGMYYGNSDAWYGRPDLMLAGNPFAKGKPAGAGYSDWLEGFFHFGLYGITPLSGKLHAYAGLSAIGSGSIGQELFTDQTRSHSAVEDAFVGLVGGSTSEAGDRFVWTASAGRQRFAIGDGFLIVNTATNGLDRAALQSNPRWAADMLVQARLAYNNLRAEVFHVDPDEIPEIDSGTRIQGANFEAVAWNQLNLGLTALRVPSSTYAYYTTSSVLGREGLRVLDARLRWQPEPAGRPGPFLLSEVARQTNRNFDMEAWGYMGEVGYVFASSPWTPTISYRYARFSGDDPASSRFERWDPLLSGGNGETWVQGINHFKIFQNSNLITHRLQARLRPAPAVELVPQLWFFRADSTTNLGGNPALSILPGKDLGFEANITAKYFLSRNVMVQGHVAATFPGKAVEDALGSLSNSWISAMAFLRVGF